MSLDQFFKISHLCYDKFMGNKGYVSQLISIVKFRLEYRVLFFKISLCYDEKWVIKLCISVNIYRRLPKLGMSTHVFKISLCYDKNGK